MLVDFGGWKLTVLVLDMWLVLRFVTFVWEVGAGRVRDPQLANCVAGALNPFRLFYGSASSRVSRPASCGLASASSSNPRYSGACCGVSTLAPASLPARSVRFGGLTTFLESQPTQRRLSRLALVAVTAFEALMRFIVCRAFDRRRLEHVSAAQRRDSR